MTSRALRGALRTYLACARTATAPRRVARRGLALGLRLGRGRGRLGGAAPPAAPALGLGGLAVLFGRRLGGLVRRVGLGSAASAACVGLGLLGLGSRAALGGVVVEEPGDQVVLLAALGQAAPLELGLELVDLHARVAALLAHLILTRSLPA